MAEEEENTPLVSEADEDKKEEEEKPTKEEATSDDKDKQTVEKEEKDEKEETKKEDKSNKDADEEEEEKKEELPSNVVPLKDLIPADYKQEQRPSMAQVAPVPAYPKGARRLSKMEMQTLEQDIDKMTEALISDPQKAVRKYSKQTPTATVLITAPIEEEENKYADDKTQENIQSAFHTKPHPDKLTAGGICLGLLPLCLIVFVTIVGIIIYSISNKNDNGSTEAIEAGPYGDWPNYGGNIANQQRAAVESMINSSNIDSLRHICQYEQEYESMDNLNEAGSSGYIVTDEGSENGFFVDASGFVTSIDLDSCSLNWRVDISTVLGVETKLISRKGVALYVDSSGRKGVLIGTPNGDNTGYQENCYILSLKQEDGSKIFSIETQANGSPFCETNGFIVDGHYAYGGIIAPNTCNNPINGGDCTYRGELIKIDLDKREIVDRWYSLSENNGGYIGAAPLNYPSIIGDYLIIGTGALFKNPDDINTCLLDENVHPISAEGGNATNPCGIDRSDSPSWRCYEADINVDSVNILNKTSMEHIKSKPLSGNDVSTDTCNLWNNFDSDICGDSKNIFGADSAPIAQAAFSRDGDLFSAFLTKSGMFYVFQLPSLQLSYAKKIGPAGGNGGGLYSLAIDDVNYIAILSITGLGTNYRHQLVDKTYICQTGYVEAIDLITGDTLWQFVNPYGVIGDDCTEDMYNATDWSVELEGQPCRVGVPSITDVGTTQVIKPDVDSLRMPQDSYNRANFIAPVTISQDLVFIPSNTGDVFVVNIEDGEIMKHLSCLNSYNSTLKGYNRAGISGGVTVVRDRAIVYCGSGEYGLSFSSGREVRSYQLD